MTKRKRVTFDISTEDLDLIDAEAKDTDSSRSKLLRYAVGQYAAKISLRNKAARKRA